MMPRRNRLWPILLGGAALFGIGAGGVALGQAGPESLLPPGFGDPAPPPPVQPPRSPAAVPAGPGATAPAGPVSILPPPPVPIVDPLAETPEDLAVEEEIPPSELELPDYARRSIDGVGPYDDGRGLGPDAYGAASGRFVAGLMRRMDAPVPSRWQAILLRRALLTRTPAPRLIRPVDWVAERAWLLLRLGEADAARMLVQSVDVDRFTPRMFQVAMQVALATADPAGMCGISAGGGATSQEPAWTFATAICNGLSGETATANAQMSRARTRRLANRIDLLLTEKAINTGSAGRRAINIEWTGVERLTAWRFGLSTALGVAIPDTLFATVGPQVQAWQARAAMLSPQARARPARVAAAMGVFSNAALVDLYGSIADRTDPAELGESDAGRLRAAYVAEGDDARLNAMRRLWDGSRGPRDRYAAAVLTARAAAAIRPDSAHEGDAAALIAAMFSAGLDRQAARWGRVVDGMSGADADAAWAMLAVGAERPAVDVRAARVSAFVDRAGAQSRRARLIVATLAGLGRVSPAEATRLAQATGVEIDAEDRWTRALDLAVQSGQPGTVAILVGTGMQARSWAGVPARYVYRMISALRRVGLEGEARMIAAEAMSRS